MKKCNRSAFPVPRSSLFHVVALGGLLLLVPACGKNAPPPSEAPPLAVTVATVEEGSLLVGYKASATLEAWDRADISAEIAGMVRSLPADEGDEVRAGTVLASLDASVLASNVTEVSARFTDAEIALADAQSNLNRVERLFREGVASQVELDNASVRLDRAEKSVAAMRGSTGAVSAQLAKATIRSPISGIVTKRQIDLGEMASPGRMLFRIENLSVIKAIMHITAREIQSMAPGDSVFIVFDGGDSLIGAISYVSPAADPIARTVKVEARFENADRRIRTGVFAEATIVRSVIPRAVLVPKSALIRNDAGVGALYVVEGGVVRKRDVRLGAFGELHAEVVSGLAAGEVIVPADHASLTDGVKVNPITKSPRAPEPMGESSGTNSETGGR